MKTRGHVFYSEDAALCYKAWLHITTHGRMFYLKDAAVCFDMQPCVIMQTTQTKKVYFSHGNIY